MPQESEPNDIKAREAGIRITNTRMIFDLGFLNVNFYCRNISLSTILG
jgi:hypothetical protein